MSSRDKDRLTNAIVALVLGFVVFLSRDFLGLLFGSMSVWVSEAFIGRRRMGGDVFSLLFELVLIIVLAIIGGICLIIIWILSSLNKIYLFPALVMLTAYATPWPFRLGFLNFVPYLKRASRWMLDMFILASFGEYLRRGRGKNIVFIILPTAGCLALLWGVWGLWKESFNPSWSSFFPSLNISSISIMPRERTLYINKPIINPNLQTDIHTKGVTGIKIQKVILGRENTKLVIRWWIPDPMTVKMKINPWAGFSPSSYIIDDQGNKYSVIGSEGMEFGKDYFLMPDQPEFATLIFEPLRENAAYFDLHFVHLESGVVFMAKQVKIR